MLHHISKVLEGMEIEDLISECITETGRQAANNVTKHPDSTTMRFSCVVSIDDTSGRAIGVAEYHYLSPEEERAYSRSAIQGAKFYEQLKSGRLVDEIEDIPDGGEHY